MALRVVGLKMNGVYEGARDVAMRIVQSEPQDVSNGQMTGMRPMGGMFTQGLSHTNGTSRRPSTSSVSSLRALQGSSLGRDFQSVVIEFLKVLDVDVPQPNGVSTGQAISAANATGQTMLHLACMLGFHRLVSVLVERGINLDERDVNGLTALHFAALCGRVACARTLVDAGADTEIVDGRGKSAREIAREADQVDVEAVLSRATSAESPTQADVEVDESAEDSEGLWWTTEGETEEESDGNSRSASPTTLPPLPIGEAATTSGKDNDDLTFAPISGLAKPIPPLQLEDDPLDKKVEGSFFHRTLSHLQPPAGMNLAFPPWAIPHLNLPIALPVQVPLPTWPTLLQWQRQGAEAGNDEKIPEESQVFAMLWAAYALATPWRFNGTNGWWPTFTLSDGEVPMYPVDENKVTTAGSSNTNSSQINASAGHRMALRPEYSVDEAQVSEREITQFSNPHHRRKSSKSKLSSLPILLVACAHPTPLAEDHMLRFFWFPILICEQRLP